jgi:predicted TPR repeat methyltransferase
MMRKCAVCGSSSSKPLYAGILKCADCGYVFADVHLSDEECSEIYRKNYFFGDEYSDYIADKKALQRNFELRLKVLRKYLDPVLHKNLLEVGSAYGFFLEIAKNRFENVQGIDITEDGVRYSKEALNLDVIHADLLQHDFSTQKFDVVCMWDTIEHLRAPRLYLEKIAGLMEKGALIAITTGDIGSVNARLKKDKWRLIHPPTHAHYFSKKTLGRMLDDLGFEIIYNRYCGSYRSIGNIAHNIFLSRKKWAGLHKLMLKSGLTSLDFYLNLYDIMYVIARKR